MRAPSVSRHQSFGSVRGPAASAPDARQSRVRRGVRISGKFRESAGPSAAWTIVNAAFLFVIPFNVLEPADRRSSPVWTVFVSKTRVDVETWMQMVVVLDTRLMRPTHVDHRDHRDQDQIRSSGFFPASGRFYPCLSSADGGHEDAVEITQRRFISPRMRRRKWKGWTKGPRDD